MNSLAYAFMLNMWTVKKIDEDFIQAQANLGRLTQNEVTMILATPQNN